MKNRITPDNITSLGLNEIFVFGSNESGKHGRGAAKTALKWGAKWKQAEGLQGRTYGIPTKNASITKTLSVDKIQHYVDNFIDFAAANKTRIFLVTEIGCGLAGLKPEQIAPLFADTIPLENVYLPERFWTILLTSTTPSGANSIENTEP